MLAFNTQVLGSCLFVWDPGPGDKAPESNSDQVRPVVAIAPLDWKYSGVDGLALE